MNFDKYEKRNLVKDVDKTYIKLLKHLKTIKVKKLKILKLKSFSYIAVILLVTLSRVKKLKTPMYFKNRKKTYYVDFDNNVTQSIML